MKKVIIIGAGAGGLAAAYELQKQDVDVVVLEKAEELGGLAGSLKVNGTPLERFYHHLFASDKAAIELIEELGLSPKLKFYPANNAIYYEGKIYPFSSPVDMLKFPPISFLSRIRFAASSAYLKATNNWKSLEQQLALEWMRKWAGKQATKVIWEPLIYGKFGDRAKDVSMAWLWARIHYRTFQLGYMEGGFEQIYEVLAKKITDKGGSVQLGKGVDEIKSNKKGVSVRTDDGKTITGDAVLVTVAEPLFKKMAKLEAEAPKHEHLGATCFTLELNKSLLPTYWLNINDTSFPFLAVVEHTKLMGPEAYGGKHIVYVGNYIPRDDWRYTSEPAELLKKYIPYIKELNPEFDESWIDEWHFSKAPFTQPIVTRDFAEHIPPLKTDLPHVWMANMAQIYPQDRGQNYAFAMAKKVVKLIEEDLNIVDK